MQELSKDTTITPTQFLMADLCQWGKQDELKIIHFTAFGITLDAAYCTCWWPQ